MLETIVLGVFVSMVIILNIWALYNWSKHILDPISRRSDTDYRRYRGNCYHREHHNGDYPYLDK
jgi:hypothetical protein